MDKFINKLRSSLMYALHHTFRFIWASLIGVIFHIIYFFKYSTNEEYRTTYLFNRSRWDGINIFNSIVYYIRDTYKYKYDGKLGNLLGIFDHYNLSYEWFISHGDCDDVANYVCEKLRKSQSDPILGELTYCNVHGFSDLFSNKPFWHYDVVYKFSNDDKYYLFNYGNIVEVGSDLTKVSEVMQFIYTKTRKFTKGGVISWICRY